MSDSSLLNSVRSAFLSSGPTQMVSNPSLTVPMAPSQPRKRLIIPPVFQAKIAQRQAEASITTQDKLDMLGGVLDEIEAERVVAPPIDVQQSAPSPVVLPALDTVPSPPVMDMGAMAQALPQATLQSTDTLNPLQPVGTTIKESHGLSAVDMVAAAEAGTSLQMVEQEKSPELPPEVESFLEKIEEHHEQAPQEIVLAGDTAQVPATTHHPSQPVVVLPITPDVEKTGAHANLHWSVRWLVEWSHKVVKMFTGKVIYRELEPAHAS